MIDFLYLYLKDIWFLPAESYISSMTYVNLMHNTVEAMRDLEGAAMNNSNTKAGKYVAKLESLLNQVGQAGYLYSMENSQLSAFLTQAHTRCYTQKFVIYGDIQYIICKFHLQ
jgi:hypothetical protein